MTELKDLLARCMEDPAFREEYGRIDEEYALIEALIRARSNAKLTQAELAERLGTTQSAVARLEGGRVSPSFATLRRFAEATGTRLIVSLVPADGSHQQCAAMRRVLENIGRIAGQRGEVLTERRIEALVDVLLKDRERTDFDREIERENAALRVGYLKDTRTWTAADIHEHLHGRKRANPSEPASRWRRERKVFAVRSGRAQRFPIFQFADGRPRPVIAEILKRLPEDMTPWQIAFWFEGGNGWLDGRAPENALDDRDNVLMAADRSREMHVG